MERSRAVYWIFALLAEKKPHCDYEIRIQAFSEPKTQKNKPGKKCMFLLYAIHSHPTPLKPMQLFKHTDCKTVFYGVFIMLCSPIKSPMQKRPKLLSLKVD
jgi:hypothetical protein